MKFLPLILLISLLGCSVEALPDPEPSEVPSGPAAPPADFDRVPEHGPNLCANKYSSQGPFPVPVMCQPYYFEKGRPQDYRSNLPQQEEMPQLNYVNGT